VTPLKLTVDDMRRVTSIEIASLQFDWFIYTVVWGAPIDMNHSVKQKLPGVLLDFESRGHRCQALGTRRYRPHGRFLMPSSARDNTKIRECGFVAPLPLRQRTIASRRDHRQSDDA
jgi:hypothetical protein